MEMSSPFIPRDKISNDASLIQARVFSPIRIDNYFSLLSLF